MRKPKTLVQTPDFFELLSQQLKRRRVRAEDCVRYVQEMREHYEDVSLELQTTQQISVEAANLLALQRLGDAKQLAKTFARSQWFYSLVQHRPWLVFLVLPITIYLIGFALFIGVALPVVSSGFIPHSYYFWENSTTVLINYLWPLLLASVIISLGVRHHARPIWIAAALTMDLLLFSILGVEISISPTGFPMESHFSFGIGTPSSTSAIVLCVSSLIVCAIALVGQKPKQQLRD